MLTPQHRDHLLRFRIPLEMIEAGGISSVEDPDTRELLGVRGRRGQDLSGIYFPFFDPITGQRTGACVRLDHPDEMKYLMEEACRHLFFPHGTPASWLADVSIPAIFVEATKAAIAIAALGQRLNMPVVPIATGGVWSWKRRGGKQTLPDGSSKYVTAPSPDLALCTWNGGSKRRDVIILFDSNVATNFEVQWARVEFSKYLEGLGANVLWAEVPTGVSCNGPDDFIAMATDTEAVERMLNKVTAFKETKKEQEEKEQTQTAAMVQSIGDIAELFHSEQTAYAVIPVGDHKETWRIGSQMFRRYITYSFYQETKTTPGAQAVLNAITLLEAKGLFEGDEQSVSVRVAEHKGDVWLDLANEKWQAIRVTKDGWNVVDNPTVRFLRPRGVLRLPIPQPKGSIKDLRRFLSLASDDDFILVVAFLVAALRPKGPYAVLVIVSEQGSGKTTMSRMIRALIDPNFAATRSEPRENRDLAIACRNSHLVCLDNVSHLQPWLSDTLARISTGDAFATRQLHTDAEEILFAACRPELINGITAVPHRPDLLDRSIIVNAAPIPDDRRRPEDELWAEFESARPGILGALLDAVVTALGRIDEVKLDRLPRMADLCKWVVAAEPALPWDPGAFMKVYSANRQDAVEQILDSDPVADLCRNIADWQGTAAELLTELNQRNPEASKRKDWPYDRPVKLSNQLKRLAPPLRRVGIQVTWLHGHHPRRIAIHWINGDNSTYSSHDEQSQEDTEGRVWDDSPKRDDLPPDEQQDGLDGGTT